MAEFRRTHADSWHVDKQAFNEEQMEVGEGVVGKMINCLDMHLCLVIK